MARLRHRSSRGPRRLLDLPARQRDADVPGGEDPGARRASRAPIASWRRPALILKRGHELAERAAASSTGRNCRSSAPSALPAASSFPAPSARCISSVSSQRPCLKPEPSITPICAKAERLVQADRGRMLGAAADDGDHLAEARRLADARSARPSSARPMPAPLRVRRDVDAVLDGEAVGGPRPVGAGIGVAEHGAVARPPRDAESPLATSSRQRRVISASLGRLELVGCGAGAGPLRRRSRRWRGGRVPRSGGGGSLAAWRGA